MSHARPAVSCARKTYDYVDAAYRILLSSITRSIQSAWCNWVYPYCRHAQHDRLQFDGLYVMINELELCRADDNTTPVQVETVCDQGSSAGLPFLQLRLHTRQLPFVPVPKAHENLRWQFRFRVGADGRDQVTLSDAQLQRWIADADTTELVIRYPSADMRQQVVAQHWFPCVRHYQQLIEQEQEQEQDRVIDNDDDDEKKED